MHATRLPKKRLPKKLRRTLNLPRSMPIGQPSAITRRNGSASQSNPLPNTASPNRLNNVIVHAMVGCMRCIPRFRNNVVPKKATMKKLLLLLLFAICAIGWRSETIMSMLGIVKHASAPQSVAQKLPAGMSLTQYAELAKTDPDAYRKLFLSHQQEQERSEVDKLMNFFTQLKYE